MPPPGWYALRLSRMGPAEVRDRLVARAVIETWRRKGLPTAAAQFRGDRRSPNKVPDAVLESVPAAAREAVLAAADLLLNGELENFGVLRTDLVSPDWSLDPRSGRRAPQDVFAFDIPYRDENAIGDVKQIWELSRHHHLTVLAAAWALSHDERYAQRVAEHLKSWWSGNPPLEGVQWVSGIELGIRLISWAWVRRLLADWPDAARVFEENPAAIGQIHHHQVWLAALPSVGSSANNHLVAEAAGRFVAACAFDWYPESALWRRTSLQMLLDALDRNTFESGLNRELASDYHCLVLELGLVALAEADAARYPVPPRLPKLLAGMADVLAAVVDVQLRAPRQGDGDDGKALDLGNPHGRAGSLLATSAAAFAPLPWWPTLPPADVHTAVLRSLIRPRPDRAARPQCRPAHLADAGLTILRALDPDTQAEIWLRCDGGPHGFGSIAAHAHADALSVELRIGGVDVLADTGTYCYHGQPEWRENFRSTRGHNTLELAGQDQSESGGPFLWIRHARSRVIATHQQPGGVGRWIGEHDGYLRRYGARHRRSVVLDPQERSVLIRDEVTGPRAQNCRLSFHLGPMVQADLDAAVAELSWGNGAQRRRARLTLPDGLIWTAHRGDLSTPAGWYSPGFGRKEPAWALIGRGVAGGPCGEAFVSRLELA